MTLLELNLIEAFERFNQGFWETDESRRTITKIGAQEGTFDEWKTAYGRIPMYCDGAHEGVRQFELKVVRRKGFHMVIGIDEGRNHTNSYYYGGSTYHYGLCVNGYLYEKGQNVNIQTIFPNEITYDIFCSYYDIFG